MTEQNREAVLVKLSQHRGRDNGIHAEDLVRDLWGDVNSGHMRHLRKYIVELRMLGHHVCGTPEHGYFIANDEDELLGTVQFLHDRAMTSLSQAAAMKRVSLPDLAGQLGLRLENKGTSRPSAARDDDPKQH